MHNSPNAKNTRKIRVVAHLKTAIRRYVNATMDAEEAADHLAKIGLVIFWLSLFFKRGTKRLPVDSIFRVSAADILRHFEMPDSIPLSTDLTSALRLLREDAILFGCWGTPPAPKPVSPSLVSPGKDEDEDEEWPRLAPGYLANSASNGAQHLQE